MDTERRSALLQVKLGALVRDAFGVTGAEQFDFAGGAALRHATGGYVLVEDEPERALGRAWAWADRHGVDDLHVLVENGSGALARRAGEFYRPSSVWSVQGRAVSSATPEPLPTSPEVSPAALEAASLLSQAGAEVVVEHGVVTGEVAGLEIARIVEVDGEVRIQAGVGRHDREAFAMIHGDLPPMQAVAAVVTAAAQHRRADGPDHPLRRLGAERWLRELVVADPAVVGAAELHRHQGPAPKPNVKEPFPAVAAGPGVVAVCSTGIDLDLVPFAVDARLAAEPGARLVLVVPERDAHPVTRAMAAALRQPAEVVTVPAQWRMGLRHPPA